MIENIELKNFTAFNSLSVNFSPKINVVIGENGTGKTHLLKAAYGLCNAVQLSAKAENASRKSLEESITNKFLRLFSPIENRIGKIKKHGASGKGSATVKFSNGETLGIKFQAKSKSLDLINFNGGPLHQSESVFIPTKEVLSVVKGMTCKEHDQKTVELIFDDGYIDLARALIKSGHIDEEEAISRDPRLNAIIPKLVNLIGGRFEWVKDTFCFQCGKYEEKKRSSRSKALSAQMYQDSTETKFTPLKGNIYSSSMTAEGFRKIGILHRLLSNGAVNPGTNGPLFWDEPESNMNPNLMQLLVKVLLELSRNGQQIILATHDYVLLKWFDILLNKEKEDHIRFHLLASDSATNEITIESLDSFEAIAKSTISDTFAELYDEDVKRALR